jgi:triacylglycerol lipase
MSALVEFPPELYDRKAFDNFSPASEFRLGNALAMMWFSQLAYETGQPDTITHARGLWQFDRIETIAKHVTFKSSEKSPRLFSLDTRGVIGTKGDVIVIGFGGTDAFIWENVWTDIDFLPEAGSDVHAGFQAAFNAVGQKVLKALQSGHKHLFVTGHSLGAAIAALAAMSALKEGFEPTAIYTFGMPRVGGRTFASTYITSGLGPKTYRLVHGLDVVPRVPPTRLKFFHVGRMLHCESGQRFAAGPLSTTDNNEPTLTTGLASGLFTAAKNALEAHILSPPGPGPLGPLFRVLPQPIRDHLQDRYIAALS